MRTVANRGSIRAVVAAGLLAIGASMIPAHAATAKPAPVLLATSVDKGWSASATTVAATYGSALVRSASSITLTDGDGTAVPGLVSQPMVRGKDGNFYVSDARTLIFTADKPLDAELGPYSVTFDAHAQNQDPAATDTITNLSFRIDNLVPITPNVDPIAGGQLPVVVAVSPSDPITLAGSAQDAQPAGVSPENVSGLASVVVHLYNPLANQKSSEVKKVAFPIACSSGGYCPVKDTIALSFTPQDLGVGTGLWTMRVSTVDAAGNQSGESASQSFLVLSSAPNPPSAP